MKKLFNLLLIGLLLFIGGCSQNVKHIDITFKSNDEIVEVFKVVPGNVLLPPDNITKEGYQFAGWFFDPNFDEPYDFTYIFQESKVLYAKWVANVYDIKFQTIGGSAIPSVKINHDELLTKPKDPTKDDYIFKGWYLDNEYKVLYDFNKPVTFQFDLYAKWEEIVLPLLELEEYEVKYIVTSPGEDASSTFNINYQTKNIKTSLEWTKSDDVEFINANTAYPDMRAFEMLKYVENPFERRNICRITLTGLEANTHYIYRVNKGNNTYSDTYHFTTSGNDDKTSFIFMTDIHYYSNDAGAEVSETVISKALEIQPNIDFLLTTGDVIDRGGNSDHWDTHFTKAHQSFTSLPYVGVPGNHEHYQSGPMMGPMQNKVYTSYYNFPRNGIEEYKGASYYFIHNDTLFIQIDTDSPYNQGEQIKWLEEVIKNNSTKFVIVGTHAPVNEAGPDYNRAFMEVLEKYGVDLVLAGHYHSESFKTLYLDQKPDNNMIGVTYLRGSGGGVKGAGSANPEEFAKGYIIDILDDSIQVRFINGLGNVLQTKTIKNHKLYDKEEATKEELLASINAEFDTVKQQAKFTWSSKFYKNVKHMTIEEAYRDQRKVEFIFPTPGYVSYSFDKMIPNYDSKYYFEITFADDSKERIEFLYKRAEDMGLIVHDITATSVNLEINKPSSNELNILKHYAISVNGQVVGTFDAKNIDTGEAITTYSLTGLKGNTDYKIVIEAYSRYGLLYFDEVSIKTK